MYTVPILLWNIFLSKLVDTKNSFHHFTSIRWNSHNTRPSLSDANYDLLKEPLEGKKRSSLPGTIPSDEAKVWRHHYDLLALFGTIDRITTKKENEIRCRTWWWCICRTIAMRMNGCLNLNTLVFKTNRNELINNFITKPNSYFWVRRDIKIQRSSGICVVSHTT